MTEPAAGPLTGSVVVAGQPVSPALTAMSWAFDTGVSPMISSVFLTVTRTPASPSVLFTVPPAAAENDVYAFWSAVQVPSQARIVLEGQVCTVVVPVDAAGVCVLVVAA